MRETIVHLTKRMKFPLIAVAFSLIVLLVVRPFLLTGNAPIRNVVPFRGVVSFSEKSGPVSANIDLAESINTFTGVGRQAGLPSAYSGGETFPGAASPFGMVQWSPDNMRPAYSGYNYRDNRIKGFSLTHLSGAGCSAYGDVPFMPYTSAPTTALTTDLMHYYATFSHNDEVAHAGYYRVRLNDGVTTELTVTQHSGAGRFTYPAGQTASMLVNLAGAFNRSDGAQAMLGHDTISGWASSGNFCGTRHNGYRVYFWAQFSQPFVSSGIWHNGELALKQREVVGPNSAVFMTFDTRQHNAIGMRVGVSFVSVANAEANVKQENPQSDFEAAHQQATATWNRWLNKIQVSGGTEEQRSTFYSALYHSLLFPSVFSDVNGQYTGFDGQVHIANPGHAQYANFSGWDIYRSETQLLALLAPDQASDMAQSLLNDYEQSGHLPKWSLANSETYVMVGDPADAIIAGIYAFGGTQFDAQGALAAMIKQATQPNPVRPGLNYLDKPGYEPVDGVYSCCGFYGPASTTLEYNAADFAIGSLARYLGDNANAQKFTRRAQGWRNLFNPATGYLEPRYLNGVFLRPYSPSSETKWVEGNGAQYTWMVPFNLRGLFDALGGNPRVVQRLDAFFTELNAGLDKPYAFLGNEPTLETPWEYDYAGAPYKTQHIVRRVVDTLYSNSPNGLPGNDDLGEMSSWYVFAALGMYPETPGTATLVLASPLFPHITLHRGSGQVIQINAPQASASSYYVQSLKVNGQISTRAWLPAAFIAKGGTLDYTLASTPNVVWGAAPGDAPPSYQ